MRKSRPYLFYTLIFVVFVLLQANLCAQVSANNSDKKFPGGNVILNQESLNEMQIQKSKFVNLNPELHKISSDLLQLLKPELLPSATSLEEHAFSFQQMNALRLDMTQSSISDQVKSGRVYVYIYLKNSSNETFTPFQIEITDRDEKNHIVVAWVTLSDLEIISRLDNVKSIQTVFPPVLNTGSVNTQGDIIHRTSNVRSLFNFNGTGINIGVVSDGVTNRSSSQSTGDLPADGNGLTVLNNSPGGNEGTAILEILHDVVPGSNLFFHGYGTNTVSFNNAITNLVNAGCKIVGDDIGWIQEPFFEDGTVASHIKSLVNTNDIIYVTSAGNGAQSHYQGDFYPASFDSVQHHFGEGDTTEGYYMYLNIPTRQSVTFVLQWNDQFGASSNDYDIYLYRINTNNTFTYIAGSEGIQNGTQNPLEAFSWTRPNNPAQSSTYAVIVTKYSGVPRTLEVFLYPSGTAQNYSNNIKPEDAIYGHAALDEVVSAGAVNQSTPGVIEYFSSQGPSTITFPTPVVRQTPKVVGTDFVSVTGAGGFSTSFGGTSAAMPHIQGVLAQAWSKGLTLTANQIKQAMYDWSFDLGGLGYDHVFGYGLADALEIFNNNPLPVELISFSALAKGDKIVLTWKTQTEVNNFGFEIQYSIITENGKWSEWSYSGFVEGNGNSNKPVTYSFIDDVIKSNKIKYRLKQFDTDGKFTYSKEVELKTQPENFDLSQNYPNPFNPSTTIDYSLPVESFVSISVYNLLGQEVKKLVNESQEPGFYQAHFDAAELSSGVYIYSLTAKSIDGNKTFSQTRKMQFIK